MKLSSKELYERAQIEEVERCLVRMERNGFKIDSAYCGVQEAKARAAEAETLDELRTWLGGVSWPKAEEFNWASHNQLVALFHQHLGLAPSPVWKKGRVKVDAGETKVDETALDWLAARAGLGVREGINKLIHLRRLRGSIKYLTKLPLAVAPDGYCHPVSGPAGDFDPRAGTITWRLACKLPEIQQIPSDEKKDPFKIRRAFVAPEDHTLLVADESALEVVILGHIFIQLFDDHQLADMVSPGAPDIHAVNARRVFGTFLKWGRYGRRVDQFPIECFLKGSQYPALIQLRQDIKAVWYGLMYGKSAYGFATSLRDGEGNPIGMEAAEKIVDALNASLPALPRYAAFIWDYIKAHHGVPGLGGAWADLSGYISEGEWGLKRAHRIAQNYPMQEGGARIIGHAMVGICADPVLDAAGVKLERQIHDELDFRIPVGADILKVKERINYHMTSYPLRSHLGVKMGTGANWDAAKS